MGLNIWDNNNSFFFNLGKYVSPDMVARRAAKCGDGTHFLNDENAHENPLWGYGDKDIPKEDISELKNMKNWTIYSLFLILLNF